MTLACETQTAGSATRHPTTRRATCVAATCIVAMAAGCASVRFETVGPAPDRPICQKPGEHVPALVLWGPQWRPDQKEPREREAAAQRGIERFFAASGCFATTRVIRVGENRAIESFGALEARTLAAADAPRPARVLILAVRELGPILVLGGTNALVEGGTEVVVDVRGFEGDNGRPFADLQVRWRHGGPWVVKGAATLDADITAALEAALRADRNR